VGFFNAALSFNWLYAPSTNRPTNLSQKRKKQPERTSEYLQDKLEKDVLKNRFISDYFKLVAFRSPVSSVFSDVSRNLKFCAKLADELQKQFLSVAANQSKSDFCTVN